MNSQAHDEIKAYADAYLPAYITQVATQRGVTLTPVVYTETWFQYDQEQDRTAYPVLSIYWEKTDTQTARISAGIRDAIHEFTLRYVFQDQDKSIVETHMRYIPEAIALWLDNFPTGTRVANRSIQQIAPPDGSNNIKFEHNILVARTGYFEWECQCRIQVRTRDIVVAPVAVGSVSITDMPGTTGPVSITLHAQVKDAALNVLTGRVIQWATSDPTIATVDRTTGVVTGKAVGSAIITAMCEGISGRGTVNVGAAVASVTVAPTSITNLALGVTQQLTATTYDASATILTGRTITWASSNPAVATVSGTGLVTAVAVGSCTITATSEGVSSSGVSVTTVVNDILTLLGNIGSPTCPIFLDRRYNLSADGSNNVTSWTDARPGIASPLSVTVPGGRTAPKVDGVTGRVKLAATTDQLWTNLQSSLDPSGVFSVVFVGAQPTSGDWGGVSEQSAGTDSIVFNINVNVRVVYKQATFVSTAVGAAGVVIVAVGAKNGTTTGTGDVANHAVQSSAISALASGSAALTLGGRYSGVAGASTGDFAAVFCVNKQLLATDISTIMTWANTYHSAVAQS